MAVVLESQPLQTGMDQALQEVMNSAGMGMAGSAVEGGCHSMQSIIGDMASECTPSPQNDLAVLVTRGIDKKELKVAPVLTSRSAVGDSKIPCHQRELHQSKHLQEEEAKCADRKVASLSAVIGGISIFAAEVGPGAATAGDACAWQPDGMSGGLSRPPVPGGGSGVRRSFDVRQQLDRRIPLRSTTSSELIKRQAEDLRRMQLESIRQGSRSNGERQTPPNLSAGLGGWPFWGGEIREFQPSVSRTPSVTVELCSSGLSTATNSHALMRMDSASGTQHLDSIFSPLASYGMMASGSNRTSPATPLTNQRNLTAAASSHVALTAILRAGPQDCQAVTEHSASPSGHVRKSTRKRLLNGTTTAFPTQQTACFDPVAPIRRPMVPVRSTEYAERPNRPILFLGIALGFALLIFLLVWTYVTMKSLYSDVESIMQTARMMR